MSGVSIKLHGGLEAIVSIEDADLADLKWTISRRPNGRIYVMRRVGAGRVCTKSEYLHRVVAGRVGAVAGLDVDHINGSTLDNRRDNLRAASRGQNSQNIVGPRAHGTSGHLGVTWHAKAGKWMSSIGADRRRYYLGLFDTIDAAKDARLAAELRLWGAQPRRAAAHND